MIAEILAMLIESTIALSAAALLALALRHPLRTLFGARVVYALWLLVPVAAVVALLPEPSTTYALPLITAVPAIQGAALPAIDAGRPWMLQSLLLVWTLGALIAGGIDFGRQRRFVRAMGTLAPRRDGALQATSDAIGPAVVGLWRARIVVPADFDRRFSDDERALILDHESVHVARRDLFANLVAVTLRSTQWFNPIVHLAFARFRFDQELAADAVVLQHRPGAGRPYAVAMLKTQLSPEWSPLGCHWQSAHPLKERILMLKRPLPGLRRVVFGFVLAGGLSLAFGYTAWAVQPQTPNSALNAPTYNSIKPPKYPQAALDAKVEGDVLLRVLVAADGKVEQIEIDRSTGSAALDQAAVTAVRAWRFNPGNSGDAPVPSWIGVPITFSLTNTGEPQVPAEYENALEEIYIRGGGLDSAQATGLPPLRWEWASSELLAASADDEC